MIVNKEKPKFLKFSKERKSGLAMAHKYKM